MTVVLNRNKAQASADFAFGQTLPADQPMELELKVRMPSRETYLQNKHEQLIKVKSLRYALDEMVDHIKEATAGEFGPLAIFSTDKKPQTS